MMDYAVLPPEINSARMYAGAGSAPMLTAAAGWDRLAAILTSTAGSYRAVLAELTDGPWQGSSAAAMTAAAQPYSTWMNTTAAQAAQTANQARAAAAAYEAAFAATVPPPVIAANRAALTTLVNTNVFGQNSAAIAANQADYNQMWAQDATAMHTYAANSAAAVPNPSTLTAPPQTTNPAGAGTGTNAAAQAWSSILNWNPFGAMANSPLLQNASVNGLNGFFNSAGALFLQTTGSGLTGEGSQLAVFPLYLLSGKMSLLGPGAAMGAATGAGLASSTSADVPASTLAGAHGPGASAGMGGPGASAGMGRAVPLGKLSVPPSWGVAAQDVRLAATALPAAYSPALSAPALSSAGMAPPLMGGPVGGPVASVVNAPLKADARVRSGSSFTAISQHLGTTGADEADQNRSAQGIPVTVSGLSEREQDELYRLRDELADLAMGCDAMARLTREAMQS